MKLIGKVLPIVLAVILLATACIPVVGDPLARYNSLIQSYQDARNAAAKSQACFALVGQQLKLQVTVYNSYLVADVTKTKVYRDALNAGRSQVDQASQAYKDANGNPIPANQLDLGQLAAQGATPANQMAGFTLMVNAFTEAPLATVDPSALDNTQRIISEQFNQAMSCVTDWDNAVEAYNVERNQVSGDIVGQIAERLGVKDLPESLPYYIPPADSANPFNMNAPTPAFPTP